MAISRDHAIFTIGASIAWVHLTDELLTIRFPVEELVQIFVATLVVAGTLLAYPRLGRWKGPLGIVLGAAGAFSGVRNHVVDIMRGTVSAGDASGILELAAGILVLGQGSLLTWRLLGKEQ